MHKANLIRIVFLFLFSVGSTVHAQDFLIRASDTLHFDVREIVNFTPVDRVIQVSTELCGALKLADGRISPRIFCQNIDSSLVLPIGPKPSDQKFAIQKFPNGNQSKRRTGQEVNDMAKALLTVIAQKNNTDGNLGLNQVEFRVAIKFFEVVGDHKDLLDTQFSTLPDLDTLAPEKERGLLIDRHELFNSDKTLKNRTLLVLTRRGQRSQE